MVPVLLLGLLGKVYLRKAQSSTNLFTGSSHEEFPHQPQWKIHHQTYPKSAKALQNPRTPPLSAPTVPPTQVATAGTAAVAMKRFRSPVLSPKAKARRNAHVGGDR